MSKEKAGEIIENVRKMQEKGEQLPCPRCGKDNMFRVVHRNALSRHANVYVCPECGMDEAIRDWNGNPLPLSEWALLKNGNEKEDA